MQWVMLALIVIGLIFLAGPYPRVAFGLLSGMLVIGSVFIWYSSGLNPDRQALDVSQVAIENTTVVPAYAGSHRLTGRLVNRHESSDIRELVISAEMLDCQSAGSDCLFVGQTLESVNVRIPAGQARDFETTIYLGEPTISGMIKWQFRVTEVRH